MAYTGGITNGAQSFDGTKTFNGDVVVSGTLTTTAVSQTDIDAGASGTAGTVDVFPTTAARGKIAITAADSAGNTTTTLVNASQSGARTYTIPDAGGNASFVMTAGAQTVAGVKTFSNIPVLPAGGITFDQTTNDATVVAADQASGAVTYTIPDAGAAATFVVTNSAGTTALVGRATTTDGVAAGTAKVIGGRSYALAAAGDALTNSAAETVLGSFTIPANTIKASTMIKVKWQGIATATNANDTLQIKLRFGATTLAGTAILTTAAVDVANDNIFLGDACIVGRAAPGAAAACVAMATYSDPGAVGSALKAAYAASANYATNGALLVEVTGKWSAADPGNSCRLDVLTVEVL
jgi:hypothetical protein